MDSRVDAIGSVASRRGALRVIVGLPALALLALATPHRARAASCLVDGDLPSGQRSLGRSLNYQARSADPAKLCGGCAFFKSEGAPAGCGECMILACQVPAEGVCTSWAPRPR